MGKWCLTREGQGVPGVSHKQQPVPGMAASFLQVWRCRRRGEGEMQKEGLLQEASPFWVRD